MPSCHVTHLITAEDCSMLQGPPLIVPRVIFELAPQDLVKVLQQPTDAIDMIVAEIQKQGLDGLVSTTKAELG